jgi:hypothetical protein
VRRFIFAIVLTAIAAAPASSLTDLACRLVLSTIPRNRICVTSRAVLGFHAPIVADQYREITRAINATYPPAVRAWIKHNGGLTQNVILLRGQELAALYSYCS